MTTVIKMTFDVQRMPGNMERFVATMREAFRTADVVSFDMPVSIARTDFDRWMNDDSYRLGTAIVTIDTHSTGSGQATSTGSGKETPQSVSAAADRPAPLFPAAAGCRQGAQGKPKPTKKG